MVEVCNIDTVGMASEFIRPILTLGLKANDSLNQFFYPYFSGSQKLVDQSISAYLECKSLITGSQSRYLYKELTLVYRWGMHIGTNHITQYPNSKILTRIEKLSF
jgi:hypothetical protein